MHVRNNIMICGAGKMITPERSSATFLSVVGYSDTRVDLDKSIKEKDTKYKGFLSMMASKLAYENEEFVSNAVQNHWDVSSLISVYVCNIGLLDGERISVTNKKIVIYILA